MKNIVSIMVMIPLILSFNLAIAQDKKYTPADNEALYGIWISKNYDETKGRFPAQWKIIQGGQVKYFYIREPDPVVYDGTFEIIEKWTDANDTIWYKSQWQLAPGGGEFYQLAKIIKSGETLEYVIDVNGYPEKLNVNDETYVIFQKEK